MRHDVGSIQITQNGKGVENRTRITAPQDFTLIGATRRVLIALIPNR